MGRNPLLFFKRRNFVIIGLLEVKNVPELVDIGKDAVNEVFQALLLESLVQMLLLLSAESNVDQGEETEVHLRVCLEIGPLFFHQHLQRRELMLLSEDLVAIGLDEDVGYGEEAVLVAFEDQPLVLIFGRLMLLDYFDRI